VGTCAEHILSKALVPLRTYVFEKRWGSIPTKPVPYHDTGVGIQKNIRKIKLYILLQTNAMSHSLDRPGCCWIPASAGMVNLYSSIASVPPLLKLLRNLHMLK
jgi:hypothetical protein